MVVYKDKYKPANRDSMQLIEKERISTESEITSDKLLESTHVLDEVIPDPTFSGVQMTSYEYSTIQDFLIHHNEPWSQDEMDRFGRVIDFLTLKADALEKGIQEMNPRISSTRQNQQFIQVLHDVRATIVLLSQEKRISDEAIETMIEARNLPELIDLHTILKERYWISPTEHIKDNPSRIEHQIQNDYTEEDFAYLDSPDKNYIIGDSYPPEQLSLEEIRRLIQPTGNPDNLYERELEQKILEHDPVALSNTPPYKIKDIQLGHDFEVRVTEELLQIPEVLGVINVPSQSVSDHEQIDHIVITMKETLQYSYDPKIIATAIQSLQIQVNQLQQSSNGAIGELTFTMRPEMNMLIAKKTQEEEGGNLPIEEVFEMRFVQAKNNFGAGKNHYDKHNISSRKRHILYINGCPESGGEFNSYDARLSIQRGLGLGVFGSNITESE